MSMALPTLMLTSPLHPLYPLKVHPASSPCPSRPSSSHALLARMLAIQRLNKRGKSGCRAIPSRALQELPPQVEGLLVKLPEMRMPAGPCLQR